ncbi:hypothetical protein OF122_12285 [Pelagibacterium flavum]|uniref:GIY-YIG domain-containing protein n=1 Tax=Pelagibacterium flavum TaxID=2984530 RepID=A0ABY6IK28_9HYPH|nr:hypothetical protein [Pelagibacterium sp. YIM 151497]UYQ70841.1 hypothetical protein OF122_12285 [Pelagibacterium sp. YIM 151497]
MADTLFAGTASARNPLSAIQNLEADPFPNHRGLIGRPEVPPRVQVSVFRALDETGSSTVGDLIDLLAAEPDPVSALLAMEQAGAIEITAPGFLDAHSLVQRTSGGQGLKTEGFADITSGPQQSRLKAEKQGSGDNEPDPANPAIRHLSFTALKPALFFGEGARRADFASQPALRRPGVYVLYHRGQCYVGRADNVARRIGAGRQLPEGRPEKMVAIVDEGDGLSRDDAKVLERMLFDRLNGDYDVESMINSVPHGGAVEPGRYDQLALFLSEACATLRANGVAFLWQDMRYVFAGPATEHERLGPDRPARERPDGQIYGLEFGGLTAAAAECADGRWLVMRGSEVRADFVASANSTVGFLRAQWLHSGILEPADDVDGVLVLTRDVVFPTCSGASQFLCGAKGRSRVNWTPLSEQLQPVRLH